MSFSRNTKLEILSKPIENDCCGLAFFNGLFSGLGEIKINGNDVELSFVTDIQELYSFINNIFHKLYGEYAEMEMIDEYKINKTNYFRIIFPKQTAQRLLLDCGMIFYDEAKNLKLVETIDENIIYEDCCKRSFLKGAFVGSATANIIISEEDKQRSSSGYHLEFTSHNHTFLQTLAEVLASFDILAKTVERKNLFVLYIKEANQITDILTLVEAHEQVLQLANEMAKREIRNKVNRQTNCYTANITKTVEASARQINSIETINEIVGLETLDMDLQVVALLRLANPEESLDELLKISSLKLTKSGLNHRFKKLEKIAKDLVK